jgi:Arabinose-binding domain of AraC transcription regulator, N-term
LDACRNAATLSRDPQAAFRIGCSIHLSTYGMYGYAILCCTDFRRAIEFAVKYHQLTAPLVNIAFEETGKSAAWVINPLPHLQIDAALCQFAVELQIGIHITLMRDVMGPAFAPDNVTVTDCASESPSEFRQFSTGYKSHR